MTDDDDQEIASTLAEAAVAAASRSDGNPPGLLKRFVSNLGRTIVGTVGGVAIALGLIYWAQYEPAVEELLQDVADIRNGAEEEASASVSAIPGWRPWLEEMSAIWADGDDHFRFYFSPQGIVIDEVSVGQQLFSMGQLRPTIKGTDDDNDVVVLDVLVKPIGENVQENQEWVLRRIWNAEHTSFTLRLTFTGATSTDLGFVRRFLPNELAELRVAAAAAAASAYAQAPVPKATQPPPPNAPPLQEASAPIVAPAITLKFDMDDGGTTGGLELIARKDEPLSAVIETVSGPQAHTCTVEMAVLHEVQSGVSSYTWTDDEPSPCSISIDVRDGKATVASNDQCRSYCGMNGGFVGTYVYQPTPR